MITFQLKELSCFIVAKYLKLKIVLHNTLLSVHFNNFLKVNLQKLMIHHCQKNIVFFNPLHCGLPNVVIYKRNIGGIFCQEMQITYKTQFENSFTSGCLLMPQWIEIIFKGVFIFSCTKVLSHCEWASKSYCHILDSHKKSIGRLQKNSKDCVLKANAKQNWMLHQKRFQLILLYVISSLCRFTWTYILKSKLVFSKKIHRVVTYLRKGKKYVDACLYKLEFYAWIIPEKQDLLRVCLVSFAFKYLKDIDVYVICMHG